MKKKGMGIVGAIMPVAVFFLLLPGVEAHPAIAQASRCASCAMEVLKYPGPKGVQREKTYCSARALLCDVLTRGTSAGAWVHDAGKTDWAHPEDEAFIPVDGAWYVYGSQKKAVMGPSLAPFGSQQAAQAFQKREGGVLYRFDELTPQVLGCRAKN